MGNVDNNQTGSMMLVYVQYEVDGTKDKNMGCCVSHTPDMGGGMVWLHQEKMLTKDLL